MGAFRDYEIGWMGQSYVIPSNHLLLVIAAVEEHITLAEMFTDSARRRLPMVKISGAYAAILRAAGVKGADGRSPITDEDVYLGMFAGKGNPIEKTGAAIAVASAAVQGLLGLMVPPETMPQEPVAVPGKQQPAPRRSRPLRRSTKRRLARAG
jgi:hypothetical protein